MRARNRLRPILALAAAYVVALQALLLPLSVAAASPLSAAICTTGGSGESGPAPASHAAGCAGCGMQCGVHHALAPSREAGDALIGVWVAAERRATVQAPVVAPPKRTPQIPRAPPAA